MIKRGTTDISSYKRGSVDLTKIYRGSTLLWEPSAGGFPDWTLNNMGGDDFLTPFAEFTSTATMDYTTSYTFGSFAGTNKWLTGVNGNNGKIYCSPWDATSILVIDTTDDSTYLVPTGVSGTAKWAGGVLAPNGKIYFAPSNATQVMVLDCADDSISFLPLPFTGSNKQWGGVLGLNGLVYLTPQASKKTIIIDPSDDSVSVIDLLYERYLGSSNLLDGRVLMNVSYFNNFGAVLDTDTNTFTYISKGDLSVQNGATLHRDGNIYGSDETNGDTIGVFNTTTDTYSQLSSSIQAGSVQYRGACSSPDGCHIMCPAKGNKLGVYNPSTGTSTEYTLPFSTSSSDNYWGGVLAPNGKIYLIPKGQSQVCAIGQEQTLDTNYVLSRFINKSV